MVFLTERLIFGVRSLIAILACCVCFQIHAQTDTLNIALIETRASGDSVNSQASVIKNEISVLLSDDGEVSFQRYLIDSRADQETIISVFNHISNMSDHDVIVALDIASNQVLVSLGEYPKPTFLPFVFAGEIGVLPREGNKSGVDNLNYLSPDFDLSQKIKTLQKLKPISNALFLSDKQILQNVNSALIADLSKRASAVNVEMDFAAFDPSLGSKENPFESKLDAIFLGFIPGASKEQVAQVIQFAAAAGIPAYSMIGDDYLDLGALASATPPIDSLTIARRLAIHLSEWKLGTKLKDMDVTAPSTNELTVNLLAARRLGFSPSFKVLSESRVLNETRQSTSRTYSLGDVARIAIEENLTLERQKTESVGSAFRTQEARSALLPQLNLSASSLLRKQDVSTIQSGQIAKRTSDAYISLSQTLYSDDVWSNFHTESLNQKISVHALYEIELDIAQSAIVQYLTVLLSQTTLEQRRFDVELTRENLRLSQNRVEIGAESKADLYRWESEFANAKQALLVSKSDLETDMQTLNRIINRPIKEVFNTSVETLDNPELLINDPELTNLIVNERDFSALSQFFVAQGLDRSPELKQLEAELEIGQRILTNEDRAFYVPDISLVGELSHNLEERYLNRGGPSEDTDWYVGLELSLPIYQGGARSAKARQARNDIEQIRISMRDLKLEIENNIHNRMNDVHASFNSIPLLKQAEDSALASYELTSDAYNKGKRSITEVLDAQDVLLVAREAASNSVFSFLIDLINLQRETGAFDVFLSAEEKENLKSALLTRVSSQMVQ